ncbi:helix-turn-helix domain-containing protein [Streptomyces sp.]|uniref:helix-turn-helix domain-containing protein n=1 Tax=Streptomyces sp. TaxID=1931 RepID=UPI002F947270
MAKLAELRTSRGMTQHQVARLLGTSQSRVSVIESTPIDRLLIGTIQRYLRAVGADMSVYVLIGDQTFPVHVGDEQDGWPDAARHRAAEVQA